MDVFTDPGFTTSPSGPISLRSTLHFKIEVVTSGLDTEVHLTKCRATKSVDPDDAIGYTFIQDG